MRFVKDKNGQYTKVLFNPAEKAKMYAAGLKSGEYFHYGKKMKIKLSDKQKAYMQGYLDSRKDISRAWKAKQKAQTSVLDKLTEFLDW